jgi:ankyrin repeat protein
MSELTRFHSPSRDDRNGLARAAGIAGLIVAAMLAWTPLGAQIQPPPAWNGDLETMGEFAAPSAAGKTELMDAAGGGELDRVVALLDAGAEIDARNANGGTALMYAVAANELRIARLLISRGADPNASARIGWTPLLVAAAKGRDAAARLLLEAGAEPATRDVYGWTPLMRAVSGGYLDTVDVLLTWGGADTDAREESGATALHIAAGLGFARIVERLLAAGAKALAIDGQGRTPGEVARMQGHAEAEALLRS